MSAPLSAPPPAPPEGAGGLPAHVDVISKLHMKTTDLCRVYHTAIGHLSTTAPEIPLDGPEAAAAAHDCCR